MQKERRVSMRNIDKCLRTIFDQLNEAHGSREALEMIAPLNLYTVSGASTEFLRRLINASGDEQTSILRTLAKGGSNEDVIKEICRILRLECEDR